MSVLIKGMDMPKDCPQCPCAYFADYFTFLGCNVKPGKRYAMQDEEYRQSSARPDWCPLIEVPTPHGRLIDAKPLTDDLYDTRLIGREMDGTPIYVTYGRFTSIHVDRVYEAPTIIEAEE